MSKITENKEEKIIQIEDELTESESEENKQNSTTIFLSQPYISCDQNLLQKLYVPSSLNQIDKYGEYLEKSLNTIAFLQTLDYKNAIENQKLTLTTENKKNLKEISSSEKKLLLLDIDETLLHAEFENGALDGYTRITFIDESNNLPVDVNIALRPNVLPFLNFLKDYYNLGIFTAGEKDYADAVLKLIDPLDELFKVKFYRNNCISVNDMVYIKDLSILMDFIDIKKVVLLDNSLYSFANQINNGILISSFIDDPFDTQFGPVFDYLMGYCLNAEDIRDANKNIFKFEEYLQNFKGFY